MQWFTNTCPLNYDCTRKHKCFIWKGITPFTEVAFLLWPPIFAEAWTPSRAGWACWTGPCLYRPWWHWSTSGGARISRRSEFQKVFKTKPSPGDCWGAWPCGPQCWRRGWHTGWWRSWWPRPPPAGPETRPAAQQPDIRAKLTIWAPGCLSCQYSVNFIQSSNKLILETLFHARYEILTQDRRTKKLTASSCFTRSVASFGARPSLRLSMSMPPLLYFPLCRQSENIIPSLE